LRFGRLSGTAYVQVLNKFVLIVSISQVGKTVSDSYRASAAGNCLGQRIHSRGSAGEGRARSGLSRIYPRAEHRRGRGCHGCRGHG
jgi:hypothetical protein